MDLQAHGSEPGSGDLPVEDPGGRRGLQAETGAAGRGQEEASAEAAGLRGPAVSGHTATPSLHPLSGAEGFRGSLGTAGASGWFQGFTSRP